MDLRQYFTTQSAATNNVILILLSLFGLWLLLLTGSLIGNSTQLRKMRKCADIGILLEALKARNLRGHAVASGKGAARENSTEKTDFSSLYGKFCLLKGLGQQNAVAQHIKAILKAGWDESRIDSGELIKHTYGVLMKTGGLLKGILSMFIVLGLLGTLLGLAGTLLNLQSSLNHLSMEQVNSVVVKEVIQSLQGMFTLLSSAFYPSIWGVGFTILGVFLFNLYQRMICIPLKNTLSNLTLTVWIPGMLPTAPQRLQQTLQLSEEQIRRNYEAAEKVSEFTDAVKDDFKGFGRNIREANKGLASIAGTSEKFQGFSEQFHLSVTSLSSFQTEIQNLYKQMLEESSGFRNSVQDSIQTLSTFQNAVNSTFEMQNKQVGEMVDSLKSYQNAYMSNRKEMDRANISVLDAAAKAFEGIGERNRELVETLGNPLVGKLGMMEETLRLQLMDLIDQFSRFDIPVRKAADKIEGSLESVVIRTETLTQELQREFLRQEGQNKEQMKNLEASNKQISEFVGKLAENSILQGEQTSRLVNAVSSLTGNVSDLNRGVDVLNKLMDGSEGKFNLPVRPEQHQDTAEKKGVRAAISRIMRRKRDVV